jgi:glycosyltransferase involved in cell wall biosynthesis
MEPNMTGPNQNHCGTNSLFVMHVIDKLSVSGSGLHGVSRALERWLSDLRFQGFKFGIISLRAPEPAGEIFEKLGVHVHFLDKGKFDPTTYSSLVSILKKEKPNILHLHGYGATNFGRIASLFCKIPNILHEHVYIPNQPLYQTMADTILSPLTTKAIACSKSVRDFMIEDRKINPDKVEILLYGLPLARFKAPNIDKVREIKNSLGIAPAHKIVCCVGRLQNSQKGQIFLLKAAALIIKEFPQTSFLIVGDGPDLSKFQSVAKEEGIDNNIIFTGFRDDIPAILELSDIFAMPSLYEGFPIALVEAMNLRKPIVGFPANGIQEAITDGVNGFLVPFGNIELLAERIIYLLKNPKEGQKMGEKAWKVCQNYDISFSVQRLGEIYKELGAP